MPKATMLGLVVVLAMAVYVTFVAYVTGGVTLAIAVWLLWSAVFLCLVMLEAK